MSYNRPYHPYNDDHHYQPVAFPQDLPYQEDYAPYSTTYAMNPYQAAATAAAAATGGEGGGYPPRRGDYPSRSFDYDEDANGTGSERPRESWTERNDRDPSPPYKRDASERQRRGDTYRRKPSDRIPGLQKAPPDPYTLNHIVPFPYFCEWYKQTNARTLRQNTEPTPDELQDSFIKYREDLLARTAKEFCKEHANEAWFREKYDPVLRVQTRGKLVEYRRWLYARFMEDLEAGKFDEVTLDGAAARRYFAENGGGGGEVVSPGSKKEGDGGEEDGLTTSSALARMPSDPMANKRTPCIKTINTTVSRTQLEALLGDIEGFRYLSISDPNPSKKYARVGWIILDEPPANPDQVVGTLDSQRIHHDIYGHFTVHCAIHTSTKESPRKALSESHSTPENIARDLRLAYLVATKKFEAELGDGYAGFERIRERVKKIVPPAEVDVGEDDEGMVKDDVELGSLAEMKKLLDLCIEYFRRVYSFCFYCVAEGDSVHELQRKCYAGHFRRPPPDGPLDAKAGTVQKPWLDKLNLLISPEGADVVKLGGVDPEEALQAYMDASISREAEDRWRCTVPKCTKLFLEQKFVRSHIQKRHKEWLERGNVESAMLNRYVLDPFRILPPAVEQPPASFTTKHEKEYSGSKSDPPPSTVIPQFAGFPQFQGFPNAMFGPMDWQQQQMGGYGPPMAMDGPKGRRMGPMRRGIMDERDHPYERRGGRDDRDMRSMRGYRDLDAPQEATPELNY